MKLMILSTLTLMFTLDILGNTIASPSQMRQVSEVPEGLRPLRRQKGLSLMQRSRSLNVPSDITEVVGNSGNQNLEKDERRSKVPLTKVRPWRDYVRRRPRRPSTGGNGMIEVRRPLRNRPSLTDQQARQSQEGRRRIGINAAPVEQAEMQTVPQQLTPEELHRMAVERVEIARQKELEAIEAEQQARVIEQQAREAELKNREAEEQRRELVRQAELKAWEEANQAELRAREAEQLARRREALAREAELKAREREQEARKKEELVRQEQIKAWEEAQQADLEAREAELQARQREELIRQEELKAREEEEETRLRELEIRATDEARHSGQHLLPGQRTHDDVEGAASTVVSRRFARKIVEGMLRNVRGGARLISARGNYGHVPLVNKLIDNATLIRENIAEGFDCKGKLYGYYADQLNSCQIFHICVPMKQIFPEHFTDNDVYHFSFICPKLTIFSQDAMVCAWEKGAVPCEEAHNLYYMNRNFFVISNDVQKETTTTERPYAAASGGTSGDSYSAASSVTSSGSYPAASSVTSSGSYLAASSVTSTGNSPAISAGTSAGGNPAASAATSAGSYPSASAATSAGSYPSASAGTSAGSYPSASTGASVSSQSSSPSSNASSSGSQISNAQSTAPNVTSSQATQPGSAYPAPNQRG